jgi:hypothetical protein
MLVYPQSGQETFYTDIMGTHQRLENGNRLINETKGGRIFEVDTEGEIIWEYIKPYDEQYASLIEFAHRYDKDYLTVTDWSCPRKNAKETR